MPAYIDPVVRTLRDSERAEEVTLLVGVVGDRDAFAERVEDVGASVTAQLGRSTVRVMASESVIDAICELKGVKSVELDRRDVRMGSEGG